MKFLPFVLHSVFSISILFPVNKSSAQDSVINIKTESRFNLHENKKFLSSKSLVAPVVFVGYGLISLESKPLYDINYEIREEVTSFKKPFKTRADDYMMYAPAITVYALDAAGIKAKHNFIDRTVVYTMATLISNQLVKRLKRSTHQLRPDGSTFNSFPSGHTATAFTGAEFMNQEYGFRSPWYSIIAYTVASATGGLRVMNNRHWLSDVVAGAGFGILSVKISYWVYYKVKKKISAKPVSY